MSLIYVQIPAYRDKELSLTLLDLYKKASNPKDIRVAVMWQKADFEQLHAGVARLPNLEIYPISYKESLGCNWARVFLQKLWRREPYTLFLDSHHRFSKGWDTAIVGMYENLKIQQIPKPLLTAYLPAYDPVNEPYSRGLDILKIYPMGYEQGLLTRLTSYPVPLWRKISKPFPAEFISLHFLFAEGAFNEELIMDPEIYFFGDEVVISLRAYTLGYDLFHPHKILGWHAYHRQTRTTHWNDHQNWTKKEMFSVNKIKRIYSGKFIYPSNKKPTRTVANYEDYIQCKLIKKVSNAQS